MRPAQLGVGRLINSWAAYIELGCCWSNCGATWCDRGDRLLALPCGPDSTKHKKPPSSRIRFIRTDSCRRESGVLSQSRVRRTRRTRTRRLLFTERPRKAPLPSKFDEHVSALRIDFPKAEGRAPPCGAMAGLQQRSTVYDAPTRVGAVLAGGPRDLLRGVPFVLRQRRR